MVEINSKFKNPSSRKYDKIHALLFEIKWYERRLFLICL
jgi:hypothetical protein